MPTPTTYDEFQELENSSKVGLAIFQVARRASDWEQYDGGIYKANNYPNVAKIVSVTVDGEEMELASDLGHIAQGKYYWSHSEQILYLWLVGSPNPNTKTVAVIDSLFFATEPIRAPHDLDDGYDVEWEPLLDIDSEFLFEVENSVNLLGVAISNSSGVRLRNLLEYWENLYEQVAFESHIVEIYSWNRNIPISEAALLYRGRVSKRSFNEDNIAFELRDFLDELRAPVGVTDLSEYSGAIIPTNLANAKQRRLYGIVKGHVPTPIAQIIPTTGWQITGTVSVTNGSANVSGTGTSFLAELSPGDDLFIGDAIKRVRIESVTSDTALVLSKAYDQDSVTDANANVMPSHPKRYANREFLIAGHPLSRPSAVVTGVIDQATFYVDDATQFVEGEEIEFNGDNSVVLVQGDGFIKLTRAFDSVIAVDDVVYKPSVGNVYLNGFLLELTRDYTYDKDDATLSLTTTAEFNVTPEKQLTGTIAITSGNRTITGTGTEFNKELSIGDWVKVTAGSTWYEILEVVDDETLIVRTSPGSTESGAALFKDVAVYDRASVLTCDVLGKPDDDGNFLQTPGAIAKDILKEAGLSDFLNEDSFDDADELLPHRLGLAVPAKMSDTRVPTVRDILSQVCRSAFASIILDENYLLKMRLLEPNYDGTPREFAEEDILSYSVLSDSSQIIAACTVNYGKQEYDPGSAAALSIAKRVENTQYLSSTEKELTLDTFLVDEDDAEVMASRWAFLLSRANSDLKITTKLRAIDLRVFDTVLVSHEKLYFRFASQDRTRIGAVSSIKKKITGTEFIVNDLGNAFTRVARIAEDGSDDMDVASDDDVTLNGYMTDENGQTDGETGINLIW